MGRVFRTAAALSLIALGGAAPAARRLDVLIVMYTRSFSRTLTPAQIARVHEEVAEFHDFYQTHGAGKVDFRFSLLQIDRELQRSEVSEVAPGKYYLSRENVESDLHAHDVTDGSYDEVIALYAWNNANPDDASLAYGGGAVGPDGHFLGDAGFNSIGLFAWDVERVGQILIHEVLHNVDDMFSRSGMPDDFFNSDEMSKNMPQLLRERPGAFLPRFSDNEMLAYAERERAGREMYPWAMQIVYYGWMLERTPKVSWDRLRYGKMLVSATRVGEVRPLYAHVGLSAANESTYVPVLGGSAAAVSTAGRCIALVPRRYSQVDFDGAPVYSGSFAAGWVPLPGKGGAPVTLRISRRCGAASTDSVVLVALRVGYVEAPAHVEAPATGPASFVAAVRAERAGDSVPPLLGGAVVEARSGSRSLPVRVETGGGVVELDALPPGTHSVTLLAHAPGAQIHGATVAAVRAAGWGIVLERVPSGPMASPFAVTVQVRERAPVEARVSATVQGRTVPMYALGDGRYSVNLDSLPPGLDTVVISAVRADGSNSVDSTTAWVQPWGYLRVPDSVRATAGSLAPVAVRVRSRMGEWVRGARLPLVAIVGGRATPLVEDDSGVYRGAIEIPPGEHRAVFASLVGNFQRRVVLVHGTGLAALIRTRPQEQRTPNGTEFTVAPRVPISVDGALDDWNDVPAVNLGGAGAHFTRGAEHYGGTRDLSAQVRLAWDDSTLFVAGHVMDDSVTGGEAWDTDRLNLVMDARGDDNPRSYASIAPAQDQWQEDDFWLYIRPFGAGRAPGSVTRADRTGHHRLARSRLEARRTATGYDVEVAIPRSELPGLSLFEGGASGLQLFITDGDGDGQDTEMMWHGAWPYGTDGLEFHLMDLARLIFTGTPR